jgi:hypothetical protein
MPPRVGVAAVEVEVATVVAVEVATVVAAVVVTVVAGSPVGMVAVSAAAASVAVGLGLVASGVVQLAVSVAGRWLPRSHI